MELSVMEWIAIGYFIGNGIATYTPWKHDDVFFGTIGEILGVIKKKKE